VKISYKYAITTTISAVFTAFLLTQTAKPQDAKGKLKAARKAEDIARTLEQNARMLTFYDRQGNRLNTIGARALYNNPSLSPDGKRVAYAKPDLEKETGDIWVMDLSTGAETQITHVQPREGNSPVVWSPDGKHIAYTGLRSGIFSVYRAPADGQGSEEVLYKLPGIAQPSDWSQDGRVLVLSASDLGGSVVSALPLQASGERKPVDVFKNAKPMSSGRLSPDGRLLAYNSNESGKNEVYVRGFDTSNPAASTGGPWKISEEGALPMTAWRNDGKELYFMGADRSVMRVAVTTSPSVSFGKPAVLFKPAAEIAANPGNLTISRDAERVLIAVPPPQLRQLTIFDRQGKAVRTVGEPSASVVQTHFSPDGTKVVYMKQDPKTSDVDIWTYDLENGKEFRVTSDNWPENAPIWAPDGKHVMYASMRDNYSSIYRKSWDGTGEEEMLFRYTPGAGMVLTDASPDGKFVTFYTGVLAMVPLTGSDPLARKSIDWLRDEYDNMGGRFSPDGRYIAYASDPDDPMTLDVFVRPFDPSKAEAAPGDAVQISKNGIANGMISWRADGKELFFMTRDFEVMAVDITTSPKLQAGTPKLLFKLPRQPVGNALQWKNVSSDGQRFIFSMPMR
jgi:Tol biopolymer transport system component